MPDQIINNPIINSPFEEPKRHFAFDENGITNEIIEGRRVSEYYVPIPKPRNKGVKQQGLFDAEWQKERRQEYETINKIRTQVYKWREGGYLNVTSTTRRLLDYWTREGRERRLFFCQIEAVETAIYITEVAKTYGDRWIETKLLEQNRLANQDIYRIAFKMATGSGKTLVMAMLITWQVLNRIANPMDTRFSDAFLVVTPGITIRDRLRVLYPNDPGNYYRLHDLVPPEMFNQLQNVNIIVTNYHAFMQKTRINAGKLTKALLKSEDKEGVFVETPELMVKRVCRQFGKKKNIVVINDEAHHCYRHKVTVEDERLRGEDKQEAVKREEQARIWLTGLEEIHKKVGIKVVYDLSATPFFLKGSGYDEGTLFGWVVSDFSLTDAIESGIVKVPRVPVADEVMSGSMPLYRNLWLEIRDSLPKKGRATEPAPDEPRPPLQLEGALTSLYANYKKVFDEWNKDDEAIAKGSTPPVFIVVCNNTNVSKMVYDHIAGWEKTLPKGENVAVPGKLELFSNVVDGKWTARPRTILVDSEQLESEEGMSADFKKIARNEIEQFKAEYRVRFPGRNAEELTDEDLLREVMNTVGKPGRLGEQVRCVVSVSMLTEGWDATNVTHVLGVRAFGTQLLCEQVVGRALRRMSHATTKRVVSAGIKAETIECYEPEYAEVYGVPFSFIPTAGSNKMPNGIPTPTRVRALEERAACEITFPRVMAYRYVLPNERLSAEFSDDSKMVLSTEEIPYKTQVAAITGEDVWHTLEDLKARRVQEVDFLVASRLLNKYFSGDDEGVKPWLFPQLLQITREWREKCLAFKDNTFPQMLLMVVKADEAVEKIYRAVVKADKGKLALRPILAAYDPIGSTRYVNFDTIKAVYKTDPKKCHVSHVVGDTDTWEQKTAQSLEGMDEVVCYIKNEGLGFYIPYVKNNEQHDYVPDFIVKIDDGHGREDPLNLIIEVSGREKKDKKEKCATARELWVPAVNQHGGFGRWAFIETSDPWNVMNEIKDLLRNDS